MKVKQLVKKTTVSVATLAIFSTMLGVQAHSETVSKTYNYAEAFQKSMYFYDAEKCGAGITGGKLEWRGDCHTDDAKIPLVPAGKGADGAMAEKGVSLTQEFIDANRKYLDPDGDGTVDLSGGFHDAGDHVKFGLPGSYAAATLGWGFYEFKDAYARIGEEAHMRDLLKWYSDYFLRCTFMNENGEVVAFCYQVGEGSSDHSYWGAPELQPTLRPAYFATPQTPASDQVAGAAAALAIMYLNTKDTDAAYAEKCLSTSKALYNFAVKYRGLGYSGGFYGSSYDEDELSWAAVWLNIATGEKSYINDIVEVSPDGRYLGYLGKIIKSTQDDWQNIWCHSWDVVWGGVFAKLAPITNTERDWYIFRWNIEYWSGVPHEDPSDKTFMAATPGGFKVVNTWGSARYNSAEQLCALIYKKETGSSDFDAWVKSQMNYILGDNPLNRCYEVGYAENSAKHPHHRAAHGSITNNMGVPNEHRHTLWGALVGGPDQTDSHKDDTTDFVGNEVAVDYNAGFVGALAGITKYFGQDQMPLENFPLKEAPVDEFFVESKLEQENGERTQVTIRANNLTVHPPHTEDTIKVRYFFNISELMQYNQGIDAITCPVMYDQSKTVDVKGATISAPVEWDKEKGIYYVEIDWSGNAIYGSREFHFGLVTGQDSNWKAHWDPTNDWSRQGVTEEYAQNPHISMYVNGKKVFGEEPTTKVLVIKGDADGNGKVTAIDLAYIKKYILGQGSIIFPGGIEVVDMNGDGVINAIDLALLKKALLGL